MGCEGVPFEAVNQRGLFTRAQAYAEGWTPRQARRRVQAGRWQVVAGVALSSPDTVIGPWEQAQALLLTWPGAVISHELAGALHGFPMQPDHPATATVPHGRGLGAPGLRAYQSPLGPEDTTVLGRFPITTEARTSADLLARLDWEAARSLFAWLVTRRRFSRDDLLGAVDRRWHLAGTAQLRRLAAVSASGSLSAAEDRLHVVMAGAGLTGWLANAPVAVGGRVIAVVDVLFARERVVIEVDGYATHSDRQAFQRDRSRQNQLVAAGYTVLRFTWRDVAERPQHVVSTIRAALDRSAARI
jgi:very-short-patch-repair endonuclease